MKRVLYTFEPLQDVAYRTTALGAVQLPDRSIYIGRSIEGSEKAYFHTLPGGRVDDDETPLQAALRELNEECDLNLSGTEIQSNGSPFPIYVHLVKPCGKRVNVQRLYHVFQAPSPLPVKDTKELRNTRPVPPQELSQHLKSQSYRGFNVFQPKIVPADQLNLLASDARALYHMMKQGTLEL